MGAACASILTDLGAEVHAIDVKGRDAAAAVFHRCDLADPAQIDGTVARIGGLVDAVFNCAGLPTTAPGQQVMKVNFLGHRHLTEALVPSMAGGAVAFVSSVAGMGWLQNAGNVMALVRTADFEAGRRWCEEHAEVVGPNGYRFSKERRSTGTSRGGASSSRRGACASTASTRGPPTHR